MRTSLLKTTLALLAVGLLSLVPRSASAAEPSQPNPGPEQKRLEIWAGKWTYHGAEVETPLGAKGDFKGKTTNRMLAGGFVLERHDIEKDSDWLSLMWYDVTTKSYVSKSFQPSGAVGEARVTVNGNTWVSLGELRDAKGKTWKTRHTTTFSPDGKTTTAKMEYSPDDGNTWLPWWSLTSRKTGK